MNKAAKAYFQTRVSTTDQGQLLLMLYDGALNYLQQAREKMIAKDFAGKGILISKVIDIVNELSASLNMEKGGSLAVNLNNLYILCTARLLQANLKMSVESLDSVVQILSGLRGAYAQIIETPEARRAAAEIAGRMQPKGSQISHQPIIPQAAPVTAVPRSQAQAAYGRTARQVGLSVLPPIMPPPGAADIPSVSTPAAPQPTIQQPAPTSPVVSPAPVAAAEAEDTTKTPAQGFVPSSSVARMSSLYAKMNTNG